FRDPPRAAADFQDAAAGRHVHGLEDVQDLVEFRVIRGVPGGTIERLQVKIIEAARRQFRDVLAGPAEEPFPTSRPVAPHALVAGGRKRDALARRCGRLAPAGQPLHQTRGQHFWMPLTTWSSAIRAFYATTPTGARFPLAPLPRQQYPGSITTPLPL